MSPRRIGTTQATQDDPRNKGYVTGLAGARPGAGGPAGSDRMPDQRDQHLLDGLTLACVAEHDGGARVDVKRLGDLVRGVAGSTLETVDGHHERCFPLFEVVD